MNTRRHRTPPYENEELFEETFAWIISKVLGGTIVFFILSVAAQWGSFLGTTMGHVKARYERPLLVSHTSTMARSPTLEEHRARIPVTATTEHRYS